MALKIINFRFKYFNKSQYKKVMHTQWVYKGFTKIYLHGKGYLFPERFCLYRGNKFLTFSIVKRVRKARKSALRTMKIFSRKNDFDC